MATGVAGLLPWSVYADDVLSLINGRLAKVDRLSSELDRLRRRRDKAAIDILLCSLRARLKQKAMRQELET